MLVLSGSGEDPDRTWFTGPAKLGEVLVVLPLGKSARLGYLTPMERDEAAATGLDLLDPEALDVARWSRDSPSPGRFLGDVAARALQLCEVGPGRIAIAGRLPVGTAEECLRTLGATGWSFVAGEERIALARKRKSAGEQHEVRRVAAVVVRTFRRIAGLLAASSPRDGELWLEGERLSVSRLRSEIARELAGEGLEQPRGGIVAPAEEGGVPHSSGSPDRILRAHESLVVDLFPRSWLFADCSRTFCVGDPPEALAQAHAAVVRALEQAHSSARPGVRGWELQERTCALFAEAGYATPIDSPGTLSGYVHGLGHGVGCDLHELPSFRRRAGAAGVLEEGDLLTLEPGLYAPGESGFGVRLEDLVLVGGEANELLTPLPLALDPRAWT